MKAHRGLIRGGTAFFICLIFASTAFAATREYFVYIGTYTQSRGKGIYAFRFQPTTGKLTRPVLVSETPNPSFLAVHPNRRFLYAVNEHEDKDLPGKNNTVSAYSIDAKTGSLKFLNKVSSQGE